MKLAEITPTHQVSAMNEPSGIHIVLELRKVIGLLSSLAAVQIMVVRQSATQSEGDSK